MPPYTGVVKEFSFDKVNEPDGGTGGKHRDRHQQRRPRLKRNPGVPKTSLRKHLGRSTKNVCDSEGGQLRPLLKEPGHRI